jgi:hypothetical protein
MCLSIYSVYSVNSMNKIKNQFYVFIYVKNTYFLLIIENRNAGGFI